MSNENYLSSDVFNLWKSKIEEDGFERYWKKNRTYYISLLMGLFKNAKIDIDQAKTYRTETMKFLTTKEGRKAKGKYLNWPKQVQEDFDKELSKVYVQIDMTQEESEEVRGSVVAARSNHVMEENELISDWAKDRYHGNKYVIATAHDVTTILHDEFVTDMFGEYMV